MIGSPIAGNQLGGFDGVVNAAGILGVKHFDALQDVDLEAIIFGDHVKTRFWVYHHSSTVLR